MATSLVNSVCHSDGRYGYRRYELNDGTTNELVTTILTFGEGLHNNHHRFPRDAYLSHAWYEIDINGLIILGLGKLGLVHDIFAAGARIRGRGCRRAAVDRSCGEDLRPVGARRTQNGRARYLAERNPPFPCPVGGLRLRLIRPTSAAHERSACLRVSRHDAPELCCNFTLPEKEGAGKTGCALHPRSRAQCASRKRTRAYRFSGNTPAFPAQWFYGLLRALPGDRAFLPPSPPRSVSLLRT